jgi:hypothetical protein
MFHNFWSSRQQDMNFQSLNLNLNRRGNKKEISFPDLATGLKVVTWSTHIVTRLSWHSHYSGRGLAWCGPRQREASPWGACGGLYNVAGGEPMGPKPRKVFTTNLLSFGIPARQQELDYLTVTRYGNGKVRRSPVAAT